MFFPSLLTMSAYPTSSPPTGRSFPSLASLMCPSHNSSFSVPRIVGYVWPIVSVQYVLWLTNDKASVERLCVQRLQLIWEQGNPKKEFESVAMSGLGLWAIKKGRDGNLHAGWRITSYHEQRAAWEGGDHHCGPASAARCRASHWTPAVSGVNLCETAQLLMWAHLVQAIAYLGEPLKTLWVTISSILKWR